jgi:hypothetical protein
MADSIATLRELEKKILWLASWTIHNANHLRENSDGLKVGGHQASCASLATARRWPGSARSPSFTGTTASTPMPLSRLRRRLRPAGRSGI